MGPSLEFDGPKRPTRTTAEPAGRFSSNPPSIPTRSNPRWSRASSVKRMAVEVVLERRGEVAMGPPLSPGLSPRRNLDEEVWMPHTKSFLFNRNSRSRTCSASVPYTPLRFARNHTIGNACAIPGGRKSILRDAAAERFAVWPEDGRQQPPCLSKILRRFSTSIAVGRKGLCSNVITS